MPVARLASDLEIVAALPEVFDGASMLPTRRVERVVEDVRSAEDRRARADEAERMRELRLGGRGGGAGLMAVGC